MEFVDASPVSTGASKSHSQWSLFFPRHGLQHKGKNVSQGRRDTPSFSNKRIHLLAPERIKKHSVTFCLTVKSDSLNIRVILSTMPVDVVIQKKMPHAPLWQTPSVQFLFCGAPSLNPCATFLGSWNKSAKKTKARWRAKRCSDVSSLICEIANCLLKTLLQRDYAIQILWTR